MLVMAWRDGGFGLVGLAIWLLLSHHLNGKQLFGNRFVVVSEKLITMETLAVLVLLCYLRWS
jgi:hypothetical protein